MFGINRTLSWVIVGIALAVALLAYDPNVPLDAKDYTVLLFAEKLVKFARLKRFLFDGSVISADNFPPDVAPVDPAINNYKSRFENVDVRIYDPFNRGSDGSLSPLLIFVHGGGWVKFSVDHYDLTTYDLSKGLPSYLVVSVDYRRAPKHLFPVPLEDIDVVYRFLVEHAVSYKIDVNRIVIAGDSAGGNLAAAYCLKLRDANRKSHEDDIIPMPKLQVLMYPALQAVDFKTPSFQSYDPVLSKPAMAAFWTLYLTGSEEGYDQLLQNLHHSVSKVRNSANRYVKHALVPHHLISSYYSAPQVETNQNDETPPKLAPGLVAKMDILSGDPYFSPLLAEDLTDLPRAYVIACEYDVLRDDGILYARRLSEAGVETETRVEKGAWHAIMFRTSLATMKAGEEMTKEMIKFIEKTV